jgi:uncharacterized membrane protein
MDVAGSVYLDRSQFAAWRTVAAALILSTLFCGAMLMWRVHRTGDSLSYLFIPGNLFLAWLPLWFALAVRLSWRQDRLLRPAALAMSMLWLLFLPNAPYVVTDITHLRPDPGVPAWYDAILMAAFVSTGLMVGLVSLYLMHDLVRGIAGELAGWAFVGAAAVLSGFAVYLGRVLRWNSWDVIASPATLAQDVAHIARHPLVNQEAYALTVVFGAFLTVTYVAFFSIVELGSASRTGAPR